MSLGATREACSARWAVALLVLATACDDGDTVSFSLDPDTGFSTPIDGGERPDRRLADARVDDAGARDGGLVGGDAGAGGSPLSLLLVNLETVALAHPTYPRQVRLAAYEDALAQGIASSGAQLVVLLHVVPASACEGVVEMGAGRPCSEGVGLQVQRLLGAGYAVACDGRAETACVGVRPEFGTIAGIEVGAVGNDVAVTENLPAPPCDYAVGGCTEETCDDTSAVMAVDVQTSTGATRLVVIDANGSGMGAGGEFFLGTRCRTSQVGQAFGLAVDGPTLLLGDWAFEPDQMFQDRETAVWAQHVGDGRRFSDHDERSAGGGRVPTVESPPRALSHIVSDFAEGSCEVMVMPGIVGGFAFEAPEEADGRLVNRAIRCELVRQ